MNGDALPATLHAIYRNAALSFLQYVRQISPYTADADKPLLARVRELATVELAEVEALAAFMDQARITVPHTGAFPSVFSNYNFVAVRKLLPLLVQDQQRGLAQLEADAQTLPAGPAATLVQQLVHTKRQHLTELEKLAA